MGEQSTIEKLEQQLEDISYVVEKKRSQMECYEDQNQRVKSENKVLRRQERDQDSRINHLEEELRKAKKEIQGHKIDKRKVNQNDTQKKKIEEIQNQLKQEKTEN